MQNMAVVKPILIMATQKAPFATDVNLSNKHNNMEIFKEKVERLFQKHEELITRKNVAIEEGNGIFTRYKYPVVTAAHTPVFWRYDLDEDSNPYLMERIGINATMNSGAIKWNGKYLLMVRVEGADRKSFLQLQKVPTV